MINRSKLSKVMNLKEGEESPVLLLMLFSFFLGIGVAFYYTATTSLLLVNFEREILPYAYIGGGVVVYLLSLGFAALQKRINVAGAMQSTLWFLLVSVLILLLVYLLFGAKWITLVLFIWMRVFAYVQGVTFWGLASRIFNLEQGKRLFGLIGSGEVVSHIISFFSVPFLLKIINTEDLLVLSLAGIGISMVFMTIIVKRFSGSLSVDIKAKTEEKSKEKKSPKLFKNKYFQLIFILAFVPMFANFIVDFVFLTQAKEVFSDKEVLSGFIGTFFGVTAVVELLTKTFVSGRLIKSQGIKGGLPLLPFLLGASTLLAIIAGVIFGPLGLFFSFIILGKLFMRAIRTSIYEPSFQILFQPIEKYTRLAYQSKIEGGPKAFGNIIAGAVLLLFTSFNFINLIHFNILLLFVVAFWLFASLRMTKEYKHALRQLISGGVKKARTVQNEKLVFERIRKGSQLANPYLYQFIFDLVYKFFSGHVESILRIGLSNSSYLVRKRTIGIIREKRIVSVLEDLEKRVDSGTSDELENEMLDTIQVLKEAEMISFSDVEALAKSSLVSDRIAAAVLLGRSGRYNAVNFLSDLCKDENHKIREETFISISKVKNPQLWAILITKLADPDFAATAFESLKITGARVLADLDQFYEKLSESDPARFRILRLIDAIGGDHAIRLLKRHLGSMDQEQRNYALEALVKHGYSVSGIEKPQIKSLIEQEVSAVLYVTACLQDLDRKDDLENLSFTLRHELKNKHERIFHLLSLLYESETIHYIQEVLAEESKESHLFALEILDLILTDDLKQMLVPVFSTLSDQELLNKNRYSYPQEKLNISERLCDMVNVSSSVLGNWTKALALKMLHSYPSEKRDRVLAAHLIHPVLLIRDTAIRSLYSMNHDKFIECIRMLKSDSRNLISITIKQLN